jgi:hypothetical protein
MIALSDSQIEAIFKAVRAYIKPEDRRRFIARLTDELRRLDTPSPQRE